MDDFELTITDEHHSRCPERVSLIIGLSIAIAEVVFAICHTVSIIRKQRQLLKVILQPRTRRVSHDEAETGQNASVPSNPDLGDAMAKKYDTPAAQVASPPVDNADPVASAVEYTSMADDPLQADAEPEKSPVDRTYTECNFVGENLDPSHRKGRLATYASAYDHVRSAAASRKHVLEATSGRGQRAIAEELAGDAEYSYVDNGEMSQLTLEILEPTVESLGL